MRRGLSNQLKGPGKIEEGSGNYHYEKGGLRERGQNLLLRARPSIKKGWYIMARLV